MTHSGPRAELRNRTRTRVPEAHLRRHAERIMSFIPETRHACVDITLVGERAIRALNAQYRGKDRPTDVLSFRLDDNPGPLEPFGTVVICARVAADQARDEGVSLQAMLEELILHSILHLTGSDHETDADHRAMERRRKNILKKLAAQPPARNGRA
jgi:probable rRNA maturation factor